MKDKELDAIKGECHFCGKEVNGWFYCYGCKHFICEDCEAEDPPTGYHKVEEHKT